LLEPGRIYFAPPNYHLLVESTASLALSNEDPVQFSRPAIDVLFESAADAYGESLIGIVLTGANNDGAAGLRAICEAGGRAIVQDPAEASSAIMPQSALKACPRAEVMRLSHIREMLQEMTL
jgi:two-component system chemotaxis response regulator CheB